MTAGSGESAGEVTVKSGLTKESEAGSEQAPAEADMALKEREIADFDDGIPAKRSLQPWARTETSAVPIDRKYRDTAYNPETAYPRSGMEKPDTARLHIGHLRTERFDTGRFDIDLGIDLGTVLRTVAACRRTAAVHTDCSWRTWDSCADGDTGAHTEGVASDEALPVLRTCRHQELHQLLPVCSAQPADDGYSSCRLGN